MVGWVRHHAQSHMLDLGQNKSLKTSPTLKKLRSGIFLLNPVPQQGRQSSLGKGIWAAYVHVWGLLGWHLSHP